MPDRELIVTSLRWRSPALVRPVTTRATRGGTALADSGAMSSAHAAVIQQLIDRVQPYRHDGARWPGVAAVGEGTDVRFATDRISGALLVSEGQVVHAEVHRIHG